MKQFFLISSLFLAIGFISSCQKESLNSNLNSELQTNHSTVRDDTTTGPVMQRWFFCNNELFVRTAVQQDARYMYGYNAYGVLTYDGVATTFPPELMNSANTQFVMGAKVIWRTMTQPGASMYIVERYENLVILIDQSGNIVCRGTRS